MTATKAHSEKSRQAQKWLETQLAAANEVLSGMHATARGSHVRRSRVASRHLLPSSDWRSRPPLHSADNKSLPAFVCNTTNGCLPLCLCHLLPLSLLLVACATLLQDVARAWGAVAAAEREKTQLQHRLQREADVAKEALASKQAEVLG